MPKKVDRVFDEYELRLRKYAQSFIDREITNDTSVYLDVDRGWDADDSYGVVGSGITLSVAGNTVKGWDLSDIDEIIRALLEIEL